MPKPSASQIFCTVYLGPTTLFAVPLTPTILVSMVFKSWYLMIVCVQSNTNCEFFCSLRLTSGLDINCNISEIREQNRRAE